MIEELHYQSLSDVCRQIKSGALTAAAVTEHMISRIVDLDPQLKSYALLLMESAAQTAEQLDADRSAGKPLGPLHGVPIAIKDLLFTKDVPTASGTRVMADFVPNFDATVVARLREAGAVILGKTQLTEGAFGSHHPDIDPPKNPWNAEFWPGVSSSGSGVAVAAGLAYGALGTDTGGSIRFPSASCGLVGIKPTYGRVSRHGAFALAESLDHIGPMTRNVEDAARMLAVIAGADPDDPTTLQADVPNYVAADADIRGLRIGVDWDYVSTGVDAEVVNVVRDALQRFKTRGATIEEVTLPSEYQRLVDDWGITCGVECARAHSEYFPAQKELYGPVLASLIELGLSMPPATYDEIEGVRHQFRHRLDELFDDIDLFICPCMTSGVPTAQAMDQTVADDAERAAFIQFTAPFDYSGHPTLTLPAGLNDQGLPMSFQLVGRYLEEICLVQAGYAHEQVFGTMPHPQL